MDPKEYKSQLAGKVQFTPTGYWTFIPNLLPPQINWTQPLVTALSEAERDLSRMATVVGSFPFPQLLIQPFIRTEAVISSRIEGTHASLVDLYTYETAQLSFFEQTNDVQEVYNYVRAMDYGLERLKTLPVSLRLIREIHRKLLEKVRGGTLTPGEFRRTQNWIGSVGSTPLTASYVPPPVEEMQQALASLEKFVHSETNLPALVRAGMIHYQFEAIHPFLDGNGRVGRLLIVLLFCEWGLLPQPVLNLSAYVERYRQEYYDHLLAVSQKGDWESWLRFFLRGISEQASAGVFLMEQLKEIRLRYQAMIDVDRNPVRMSAIIDFLFSRPIISIKQVAEGLEMPFKTANDYIAKLEAKGILREVTGQTRNRIYYADEILRLF